MGGEPVFHVDLPQLVSPAVAIPRVNPIAGGCLVGAFTEAGRKTATKVEEDVCPYLVDLVGVHPPGVIEIPPTDIGHDRVPDRSSQRRCLCGTIVGIGEGSGFVVVGIAEMVALGTAEFFVGAGEPPPALAMEIPSVSPPPGASRFLASRHDNPSDSRLFSCKRFVQSSAA